MNRANTILTATSPNERIHTATKYRGAASIIIQIIVNTYWNKEGVLIFQGIIVS